MASFNFSAPASRNYLPLFRPEITCSLRCVSATIGFQDLGAGSIHHDSQVCLKPLNSLQSMWDIVATRNPDWVPSGDFKDPETSSILDSDQGLSSSLRVVLQRVMEMGVAMWGGNGKGLEADGGEGDSERSFIKPGLSESISDAW